MEDGQVQNTKSRAALLRWDFVSLFIRDCILLLYGIISYADWGRGNFNDCCVRSWKHILTYWCRIQKIIAGAVLAGLIEAP